MSLTQLPKKFSLELIISVIQEIVDQLIILSTVNRWPDGIIYDFQYKSVKERFGEENRSQLNSLREENFNYITAIVTKLLEELKVEKSFEKFSYIIKVLKKLKTDEEDLLKETKHKENEVRILKKFIVNEQIVYIDKIMECMADIGVIKDQIENTQIENEIKSNYIKCYQKSKYEMKILELNQWIEEENGKIDRTKLKINQDIRVNREIQAATKEMTEELESKIEEWKAKYNEKLKEINEKLNILNEKYNKQLEIIRNFEELHSKRQKEINDYKQYKIEKEILRIEKEKRNKAATKIEAWWRGVMVRKGFGKYRKKKEKKGKKKSTDKRENK
ncbi:dynein regulatory complex protein 9-like [Diorhabda sublineata]|uniref:dynein regulatory complex protein 9-like n=1 Tax=Diorhabda sublineata TaxID=1163346 RepID=UPI0024E12F4B|nr:dynein regulatory complex protein 9-like [Diorhabda sublineata]